MGDFGKGTVWPAEWKVSEDLITGLPLRQLTDYMAHSFHIYFTNNGWYDNGTRLLFGSDRGDMTNLYSMSLESGEMTQLTEYRSGKPPELQKTFINPQRPEAYFTKGKQLTAIDLHRYAERVLFEAPAGYNLGSLSCTADGAAVCIGVMEDLSDRIRTGLGAGYIGFEETCRAKPHCQIWFVPVDGGTARVIHEEKTWVGHVNTSPTQPNLLSFCHEGPWDLVDHRIWCLDIAAGNAWKIRASGDNVFVGHEYWHADGLRIGYHGYTESLSNKDGKFIGSIRYDNTDVDECAFPFQNMHIHSNDSSIIVGDGQQTSCYHGEQFQDTICLWKKIGGRLEGPRILCRHRGSFQAQKLHVHPRFSPDGTKVLFTSDMNGYGNVYMIDVPEFESLPVHPDFEQKVRERE